MRTTTATLTLATLYLGALLIAAGGAELYLRKDGGWDRCLAGPRADHVGRAPAHYLRIDPELGWVAAPGPGQINAQGFRDPRSFDAATIPATARRVVVLGDSFMWGARIHPEESVPRRLEERLGTDWAVYNVSTPGWGLDQMYLAWLRYRDVLRPEVVVLAFIDDDVHRVLLRYRQAERLWKPAFRLEGATLVSRTDEPPRGALASTLATSVLWRCLERAVAQTTTAPAIARRIIRTIADDAAARGVRLVVLRIPEHAVAASSIRARWWSWWGYADAAPGAVYVEPLEELAEGLRGGRSLYVDDGHLTADGSALVAARLAAVVARPD